MSIKVNKKTVAAVTAATTEVEDLLDSDFYLNNGGGTLGKLASKDKRWYMVNNYDPSNVREDMSNFQTVLNSNNNNNDESVTYQTPEDIQNKLNNSSRSNFKHLTPITKSTNKLNTTNEINTDNIFFKQFNNNATSLLSSKQNSSKINPINISSTIRATDLSLKNFETTSNQHKKFLNEIAMKPKSSRASNRTNPSELDFKAALLETKNLYDLNGLETLRKYNLNRSTINYQQKIEIDNPLVLSKKHQKLLKNDISNLMTKIKKKK